MTFQLVLKLTAPIFVLVGALHLVLGLEADLMIGAHLTPEILSEPVLDSQNRFYGVAFTVYGFLLYLCAKDLVRYQVVLTILLCVFFAAGCARLISIYLYGVPSEFVLLLLASELVLPLVAYMFLRKYLENHRIV